MQTEDEAKVVTQHIQDTLDALTRRHSTALKKIVHVRYLTYPGEGFIWRQNVMTHITVVVKVFHGERKSHCIRVSILDKI